MSRKTWKTSGQRCLEKSLKSEYLGFPFKNLPHSLFLCFRSIFYRAKVLGHILAEFGENHAAKSCGLGNPNCVNATIILTQHSIYPKQQCWGLPIDLMTVIYLFLAVIRCGFLSRQSLCVKNRASFIFLVTLTVN